MSGVRTQHFSPRHIDHDVEGGHGRITGLSTSLPTVLRGIDRRCPLRVGYARWATYLRMLARMRKDSKTSTTLPKPAGSKSVTGAGRVIIAVAVCCTTRAEDKVNRPPLARPLFRARYGRVRRRAVRGWSSSWPCYLAGCCHETGRCPRYFAVPAPGRA
jgi:hypothetical protein